jgi:hypothetical protein
MRPTCSAPCGHLDDSGEPADEEQSKRPATPQNKTRSDSKTWRAHVPLNPVAGDGESGVPSFQGCWGTSLEVCQLI